MKFGVTSINNLTKHDLTIFSMFLCPVEEFSLAVEPLEGASAVRL